MVSVVSGTVSGTGAAALRAYTPAPAAGQAQLERLQHQLSDNVNCASAKTPEGKATIAAIQDKIAAVKQDQQKVEDAPRATPNRIGDTSGGVIDVYA